MEQDFQGLVLRFKEDLKSLFLCLVKKVLWILISQGNFSWILFSSFRQGLPKAESRYLSSLLNLQVVSHLTKTSQYYHCLKYPNKSHLNERLFYLAFLWPYFST